VINTDILPLAEYSNVVYFSRSLKKRLDLDLVAAEQLEKTLRKQIEYFLPASVPACTVPGEFFKLSLKRHF
jgi:hypothetical protein